MQQHSMAWRSSDSTLSLDPHMPMDKVLTFAALDNFGPAWHTLQTDLRAVLHCTAEQRLHVVFGAMCHLKLRCRTPINTKLPNYIITTDGPEGSTARHGGAEIPRCPWSHGPSPAGLPHAKFALCQGSFPGPWCTTCAPPAKHTHGCMSGMWDS